MKIDSQGEVLERNVIENEEICCGICNYRTLCSNRSSSNSRGTYVVAVALADNCITGAVAVRRSDRVASM